MKVSLFLHRVYYIPLLSYQRDNKNYVASLRLNSRVFVFMGIWK